jgi:hypothetical protein
MSQLSTILYFGESPVGYDVSRENAIYRFQPAVGTMEATAPVLFASMAEAGLEVKGTMDEEVIGQVRKLLRFHPLITRSSRLSAAS